MPVLAVYGSWSSFRKNSCFDNLIIEPAIDLGYKDVGIEAFYTEKVSTHPPFLEIAV